METKNQKIRTIERGFGEDSIWFSTDKKCESVFHKVDEIKPFEKTIGKGMYNDITTTVYQCFKDGHIIAELESNCGITIQFYPFGELA
jgi:hypothetical protein